MTDLTSTGRSELLATIAQLEDRNAALQKSLASVTRDHAQMLATVTDAQAIGTRQREHVIALKEQLAASRAAELRSDAAEDAVRLALSAKTGESTLDAAKRVASECDGMAECCAREGAANAEASAMLDREKGESLQNACRRWRDKCASLETGSLSAAHAYGCIERIRTVLEPHNCETTEELARHRMNERIAAVAGLAAAQVEISKLAREVLSLHADKTALGNVLARMSGALDDARRSITREHLDEIDPSGGVKGGGE